MTDDLMAQDRQCTATSKQSGNRCRRPAIPGGTVCTTHGGKAPQVKAAAEQRQVEAAAEAEVRKLWPGLADAKAITDPVDLLARTAGALEEMAEVIGERVNDLKRVGAGEHLTQLRAEVVLLDRILDKLLKASEGMARLGIAEKHVQLESERARMVTAAFMAALEVGQLVPEVRSLMIERFLERLSPVVPGEVVA